MARPNQTGFTFSTTRGARSKLRFTEFAKELEEEIVNVSRAAASAAAGQLPVEGFPALTDFTKNWKHQPNFKVKAAKLSTGRTVATILVDGPRKKNSMGRMTDYGLLFIMHDSAGRAAQKVRATPEVSPDGKRGYFWFPSEKSHATGLDISEVEVTKQKGRLGTRVLKPSPNPAFGKYFETFSPFPNLGETRFNESEITEVEVKAGVEALRARGEKVKGARDTVGRIRAKEITLSPIRAKGWSEQVRKELNPVFRQELRKAYDRAYSRWYRKYGGGG